METKEGMDDPAWGVHARLAVGLHCFHAFQWIRNGDRIKEIPFSLFFSISVMRLRPEVSFGDEITDSLCVLLL